MRHTSEKEIFSVQVIEPTAEGMATKYDKLQDAANTALQIKNQPGIIGAHAEIAHVNGEMQVRIVVFREAIGQALQSSPEYGLSTIGGDDDQGPAPSPASSQSPAASSSSASFIAEDTDVYDRNTEEI